MLDLSKPGSEPVQLSSQVVPRSCVVSGTQQVLDRGMWTVIQNSSIFSVHKTKNYSYFDLKVSCCFLMLFFFFLSFFLYVVLTCQIITTTTSCFCELMFLIYSSLGIHKLCRASKPVNYRRQQIYQFCYEVPAFTRRFHCHVSLSKLTIKFAKTWALFCKNVNTTIRKLSSKAFIWVVTPFGFVGQFRI